MFVVAADFQTRAFCPVDPATAEISETALCNRSVGYSNLELAFDTLDTQGYLRKPDAAVAAVAGSSGRCQDTGSDTDSAGTGSGTSAPAVAADKIEMLEAAESQTGSDLSASTGCTSAASVAGHKGSGTAAVD